MMKFKTAHFIAGAVIVTAVALPLVTMAQTTGARSYSGGRSKTHLVSKPNMVFGTVTGISGTTLTVTDAKGTIYAVDASSAKIDPGMGGGTDLAIANVAIGDKVVVTGPVTGTNEVARTIRDRSMVGRNIFTGKVTAVNGSVITIDAMVGKTKTSYTVDASSAALSKGMGKGAPATITLADIAVGDRIFAIGSLSGVNVTASSVRDLGQRKLGPGVHRRPETK